MPLFQRATAVAVWSHSDAELRLANACHPEMDDNVRRDLMWAVARDAHDARWSQVLATRQRASCALAMRMLDQYEQRLPDPRVRREGGARRHRGFIAVSVLLVLLWLLLAVSFRRGLLRRKGEAGVTSLADGQ